MVKLVGNLGEGPTDYPLSISIGIEEADYPFGLLEGLNESIQQDPIETSICELDATLVVLAESVHGDLLCSRILKRLPP